MAGVREPRYYRCPVLGLLTEDDRDEIRAKHATFEPGDPAFTDWFNDRDQCDQQAEFVRFDCEEVAIPNGTELEDQPRTGKGHIKVRFAQRSMLVWCPVHGLRLMDHPHVGHHVTAVDTRKKTVKVNVLRPRSPR